MQQRKTGAVKRKKVKRSQSMAELQQSTDEDATEEVQVAAVNQSSDTETGKKYRRHGKLTAVVDEVLYEVLRSMHICTIDQQHIGMC